VEQKWVESWIQPGSGYEKEMEQWEEGRNKSLRREGS
jgi:hypothetical protein